MTIPAEPGPERNRPILAGTGIFPGIPVDPGRLTKAEKHELD